MGILYGCPVIQKAQDGLRTFRIRRISEEEDRGEVGIQTWYAYEREEEVGNQCRAQELAGIESQGCQKEKCHEEESQSWRCCYENVGGRSIQKAFRQSRFSARKEGCEIKIHLLCFTHSRSIF